MKFTTVTTCLAVLALGACTDFDDDFDTLAADRMHCEAEGFAPGTDAMARCMNTASNARIAKEQREADSYNASLAREQAREAAAKKQHNNQHGSGHGNQHSSSHGSGHGHKGNKHTNEPTYRQSTGFDPETANMSMCSDGKLREDCSYAPLGY